MKNPLPPPFCILRSGRETATSISTFHSPPPPPPSSRLNDRWEVMGSISCFVGYENGQVHSFDMQTGTFHPLKITVEDTGDLKYHEGPLDLNRGEVIGILAHSSSSLILQYRTGHILHIVKTIRDGSNGGSNGWWNVKYRLDDVAVSTFCRFAFCLRSMRLAYATRNNSIRLVSIPSFSTIHDIPTLPTVPTPSSTSTSTSTSTTDGMVMALAIDENVVVGGYENGKVIISRLNLPSKSTEILYNLPLNEPVTSIHIHPLKPYIYIASSSSTIHRLTIPSTPHTTTQMNVDVKKREFESFKGGVSSLVTSPDGKILVCSCWDGYIRVFQSKNMKLLACLHVESGYNCGKMGKLQQERDKKDKATFIHFPFPSLIFCAVCESGAVLFWDLYPPPSSI